MTKVAIMFFALLASMQGALSKNVPRIINGLRASPGEFPYHISLYENGQYNCGGLILNQNYVLTAAHCVVRSMPSNLTVIAGTTNLDNLGSSGSRHSVTNIKVHEQYNSSDSWKNDIALLRVDPPFKFNSNLAPANIAGRGDTVNDQQPAVVSGFGFTGVALSPQLLKSNVYVENLENCAKYYVPSRLYKTNICAVNKDKITGFCKGDSGGPLTINGKVMGIVSFSLNNGCASSGKAPQVYTRISEFADWISKNTQTGNNNNQNNNQNNDFYKTIMITMLTQTGKINRMIRMLTQAAQAEIEKIFKNFKLFIRIYKAWN